MTEFRDDETITISKFRYAELIEAEKEVNYLHSHGVDNWDGYSDAMREMQDDN